MKCINCNNIYNKVWKGKYCSNKCQTEYQAIEVIKKWLGDEQGEIFNKEYLPKPVRKWLISKANNRCQKCNWCEVNPVTNKVPLVIDHIDGNSSNNRPNNLRVLCSNCDSLLPTYKSLNMGKGRTSRKNSLNYKHKTRL